MEMGGNAGDRQRLGEAGHCQGCTTFPATAPGLQRSWRNGATLTLTALFLVRAGCVPEGCSLHLLRSRLLAAAALPLCS